MSRGTSCSPDSSTSPQHWWEPRAARGRRTSLAKLFSNITRPPRPPFASHSTTYLVYFNIKAIVFLFQIFEYSRCHREKRQLYPSSSNTLRHREAGAYEVSPVLQTMNRKPLSAVSLSSPPSSCPAFCFPDYITWQCLLVPGCENIFKLFCK